MDKIFNLRREHTHTHTHTERERERERNWSKGLICSDCHTISKKRGSLVEHYRYTAIGTGLLCSERGIATIMLLMLAVSLPS